MTTINYNKLEELWESIRQDPNFDHLKMGGFGKLIPGEGDNPKCFIIGEAPGAVEVSRGRPFVGPAGAVLRQLMTNASLGTIESDGHEANCWLTNVLKYRPTINENKNRSPTPKEIADSRQYIRQEWECVGSPQIIIPVGAVALTCIMGKQSSIMAVAGKPFQRVSKATLRDPFSKPLVVWPMIHPSYGLRNEQVRPLMEKHWLALGKWLEEYDHHSRRNSR